MNTDISTDKLLLHGLPISRPMAAATTTSQAKPASEQALNAKEDKAARDTAKKFEALLLNTMLKSMRAATPGSELFDTQQTDLYRDMMDQKISEDISTRGTLGLADAIYRQLTGNTTTPPAAGNFNAISRPQTPAQVQHSSNSFINRIRSAASRAADSLGTSTEAVLAIAALETGWGKSVASNADGSSSHNLFGIKADSNWEGAQAVVRTTEHEYGAMRSTRAAFRSYPDEHRSVADFADFVQQNPRYRKALSVAADDKAFIHELHKAGYATDPDYATKVISLMEQIGSNRL